MRPAPSPMSATAAPWSNTIPAPMSISMQVAMNNRPFLPSRLRTLPALLARVLELYAVESHGRELAPVPHR